MLPVFTIIGISILSVLNNIPDLARTAMALILNDMRAVIFNQITYVQTTF